jgi:aspartate dehydrogenase
MNAAPGTLLIGHGAIARHVLAHLEPADVERGVAVLSRTPRDLPAGVHRVAALASLPVPVGFAVECAGHAAVAEWGPAVLERGIDLLVTSIGALSHADLLARLRAAALAGGARIHLSAGAIAGVDALAAARLGGLESVRYTSRKPPGGWRGTPAEQVADLANLHAATILYSGPADKAAQLYPQNANVAATVALAGLGFAATEVQLIADPAATGNIHLIEASGAFGSLRIEIRGKPLADNPKTSTLTALSVLRAIRNRHALIEI